MEWSNIQMEQIARMRGLSIQIASEDTVHRLQQAGIPLKVIGVANEVNVRRAIQEVQRGATNRFRNKVYGKGILTHRDRMPKYGRIHSLKRKKPDSWIINRGMAPIDLETGRNLCKKTIRKLGTDQEVKLRTEMKELVVVIVKDLASLHRKVHRLQYIADELCGLEEKKASIFKPHVDEGELAECFAQLVRK